MITVTSTGIQHGLCARFIRLLTFCTRSHGALYLSHPPNLDFPPFPFHFIRFASFLDENRKVRTLYDSKLLFFNFCRCRWRTRLITKSETKTIQTKFCYQINLPLNIYNVALQGKCLWHLQFSSGGWSSRLISKRRESHSNIHTVFSYFPSLSFPITEIQKGQQIAGNGAFGLKRCHGRRNAERPV